MLRAHRHLRPALCIVGLPTAAPQRLVNNVASDPNVATRRRAFSGNAIPELPPAQEATIRAIALLAYVYGVYWIIWRWRSSLNWDHPVVSLLLVIAETFGLISMAFFIFTAWRLVRREPVPAPAGLDVDVFITCYDEPLQLLRRTAIGARAIRYPHKTYMLDDGKREEVRAMAEELGIGYIRREGNQHAKAGNLNNAFAVTSGEFILQLDADHVPLPHILDRLLGYFEEPRLAFVQSPQDFYNTDSFTHVANEDGDQMWEENRLFFSLIQPGKDRMNAAFFCGSCGVLRRSAFDEIGGFSVRTITEDMETSMMLHARGWKSFYHGETLAYGLAPASAAQYHVQRLRWGQGSMQMLRKMNPLFVRGLSWRQRISYFSSVIVYLDGIQRLVFYLAPVLYFLFGVLPVKVDNHALLIRLVPYMLLTIGSFELLSRGTGYILISERYNMTRFWTYILALSGYFSKKPLRFNVTPKGAGDVPFGTYAPQFILAALSVTALLWALVARHFGWIDYHDGGGLSTAFIVNGIWVGWNLYFALYVVRHSIKSRQMRADYRFTQRLPTGVRLLLDGEVTGDVVPATTQDINSSGLSFRSTHQFQKDDLLEIPIQLAAGTLATRGRVTHTTEVSSPYGRVYTHGVVFQDMDLAMRDAIELHSAHHAIPIARQKFRQSIDLVENAVQRFTNPREGRRYVIALPAMLTRTLDEGEEQIGLGLLEEQSRGGVRFILDNPVDVGSILNWKVPGTSIAGSGIAIFSHAIESPLRVSFAVGVQRLEERVGYFESWKRRLTPAKTTAAA